MVNNDTTIKTSAGQFMLMQRNSGYAVNDGKWVVSQLVELYWSTAGVLRQRRSGTFLGVFDTRAVAGAAITAASAQPIDDRMVA
jgi:hypothetical protein